MIRFFSWLFSLFSVSSSGYHDLTNGSYSLPLALKKLGSNLKHEVRS